MIGARPDQVFAAAALHDTGATVRLSHIDNGPGKRAGIEDFTLGEQIFDVAISQREPGVEPHDLLEDCGLEAMPGVGQDAHANPCRGEVEISIGLM